MAHIGFVSTSVLESKDGVRYICFQDLKFTTLALNAGIRRGRIIQFPVTTAVFDGKCFLRNGRVLRRANSYK